MRKGWSLFNRGILCLVVTWSFIYPFIHAPVTDTNPPRNAATSTAVPDFSRYTDVREKKKAFFNYLKPEIQRQNSMILQERSFLMALQGKFKRNDQLTGTEQRRLQQLAKKYRFRQEVNSTESIEKLLKRVDIIPLPLVLMQAANESAWGTSRFAVQGYNFFGLWCFRKGCGFVPRQRDDDAAHEVAKFTDLPHAVATYLRNINSHYAYAELRNIRQRLRRQQRPVTAEPLSEGLLSYSERGQAYIDELLHMLRINRKYIEG